MEIDEASIDNLTDSLIMGNAVFGDYMEMDDNLVGDLALGDDQGNRTSVERAVATGNSTTVNSAVLTPWLVQQLATVTHRKPWTRALMWTIHEHDNVTIPLRTARERMQSAARHCHKH